MMRAKLKVTGVTKVSEDQEDIGFSAVSKNEGYSEDGSDENNTFARFTPMAELTMTIQNPNLIGKFNMGDEFYVDFSKVKG